MADMQELQNKLDQIVTYLWEGEVWHEKAANESRKISLRGWGRAHECEAKEDSDHRRHLLKLLRDKLEYAPNVDMSIVAAAERYTMNSLSDFKGMFKAWIDREKKLVDSLNQAIAIAGEVDMELYGKLCCIVSDVQDEIMKARIVYYRFELAAWNGHDLGICSMIVHKYYEDGGTGRDYNLG